MIQLPNHIIKIKQNINKFFKFPTETQLSIEGYSYNLVIFGLSLNKLTYILFYFFQFGKTGERSSTPSLLGQPKVPACGGSTKIRECCVSAGGS